MEKKQISLESVEFKFEANRTGVFGGYASRFGGTDSYGDTILAGAFKRSIKNRARPIRMRWNHYGPVIGKWTEVREDANGLYVEGELTPGHSVAEDVFASMKHGAVDGMSIGYRPIQIREIGDGKRELREIDLIEISIVEEPADLGALISDVKSALDDVKSLKEIEAILRDAGRFSRTDATALVARIKSLAHGERDAELKGADEIRALFQKHVPG